jgi:hypothetical protein
MDIPLGMALFLAYLEQKGSLGKGGRSADFIWREDAFKEIFPARFGRSPEFDLAVY